MRLERADGGDDVMGTIDQRVAELADNILYSFTWRILVLIEEDIKLSIVETKSSEVVMTWMAKVQGEEVVLGAEVIE